MGFFDELRQWHFPKEWRIRTADGGDALQEEIARLVAALENHEVTTHDDAPPSPPSSVATMDDKFVAELATGLWRMRTRMIDPSTDHVLDSMKRPFRHLESVLELLRSSGVEVQDHTSETFNSGLALSVIAFQPTEGLEREVVLETIRPSIYRGERVVQMGQVIVGTPMAIAPQAQ